MSSVLIENPKRGKLEQSAGNGPRTTIESKVPDQQTNHKFQVMSS